MAEPLPADAPAPRQCTIVKWPDFDGYGFNLHADKSKPGQYIGKVDEGSPAEAAGLRPGDRIVEVNGVNIANENHKQVVERIKAVPSETKLLVLDDDADKWYRDRKLVVKGTQANVCRLDAPPIRPHKKPPVPEEPEEEEEEEKEHQLNNEDEDNASFKSFEQDTSKTASVNDSKSSTPCLEKREIEASSSSDQDSLKKEDGILNKENEDTVTETKVNEISSFHTNSSEADHGTSNGSIQPPATESSPEVPSSGGSKSGDMLNLNMSVQEMRALLASRKRQDPRQDTIDLRQKYAIIQDM